MKIILLIANAFAWFMFGWNAKGCYKPSKLQIKEKYNIEIAKSITKDGMVQHKLWVWDNDLIIYNNSYDGTHPSKEDSVMTSINKEGQKAIEEYKLISNIK